MPGVPCERPCAGPASLSASASVSLRQVAGEGADVLALVLLGREHRAARCRAARSVSSVCADASSTNAAAVVEQLLQRLAGVVEHGAELGDHDLQVLLVDRADEVVELDQQVGLVDRQRVGVALRACRPSSTYGPSSSGGSKSRYCSPTADRLWTYIGESVGQLGALLQRQVELDAVRRSPSSPLTLPILTPR